MSEQADSQEAAGGHKRAVGIRKSTMHKSSERKIDQFEARLAGIEGLLQGLNASLSSRVDSNGIDGGGMRTYTSPSGLSDANTAYEEQPSSMSAPGRSSKHTHTASIGDDSLLFDGVTSFEGTSSMTAQTVYASEFVEQAVTGNTPMQMDASTNANRDGALVAQPDMQKALAALRKMAQQQQQQHKGNGHPSRSPSKQFSRQKPVPRGGICQLPLPPSDVVVKLLRQIRGKR
ncbi:hypothetical protein SBRCBS47491_001232 [Sporothrix bragantina]|uniref:Bzip transcription factor n=1 Tax=Sporothrix bragantina TaxID=671064 RepID=A0ABP0AWY6_9PEZI